MEKEAQAQREERIEALWKSLDIRGSGQLDLRDLQRGLRRMNHPLKNADNLLREVVKAIDTDKDGFIQYHEFRRFVTHAETELWHLFKTIDKDHNDKLSKTELREAYSSAGIDLPQAKLDDFFRRVDRNRDGVISFDEWRDFLLFIPAEVPGLKAILSYYSASIRVNPEGDIQLSDETIEGLGTDPESPSREAPRGIFAIFASPRIRHRPPSGEQTEPIADETSRTEKDWAEGPQPDVRDGSESLNTHRTNAPSSTPTAPESSSTTASRENLLVALLPNPRYFLCGGLAGIVSRTSTAPLDRLKVYLIANTSPASKAVEAAKQGAAVQAAKHSTGSIAEACRALWKAGGIRSLFAGNGLNVVKVMPESAIKFGSYEASKRLIASIEGHSDPTKIHPWSQFVAGGLGGIISQFCVYPIDTLKFRMQCEVTEGGLQGNRLIAETAKKMWTKGGLQTFYRGLPMGLVGMFPYSALDLGTFEALKRWIVKRNMKKRGCSEEQATPGAFATAFIGGFSGAFGASAVYPLNVLRTRLQTQGTSQHPKTYTGIVDVTRQTIAGEGVRGLFKGLTPNLLKVVPAVSITYVVYENSKKALKLT